MNIPISIFTVISFLYIQECREIARPQKLETPNCIEDVYNPYLKSCEQIKPSDINIVEESGINYPNKYKYSYAYFNPNNVNEIAFIRFDTEKYKAILHTFNICSGEQDSLQEVSPQSLLTWTENNLIGCIDKNRRISMVSPKQKSVYYTKFWGNFTALNTIVSYNSQMFSRYNILNSKTDTMKLLIPLKWKIATENMVGTNIQIENNFALFRVSYNDTIDLIMYNLSKHTSKYIIRQQKLNSQEKIQEYIWVDVGKSLIWRNDKGLYFTDIDKNQTDTIRALGNNIKYTNLCISNNKKYLLAQKQLIMLKTYPSIFDLYSSLVIIQLNSNIEKELILSK